MKVTFIGLGIMGSRMANNLLQNQVDLTVYNRTKTASESLVANGAKTADTASEAIAVAEIVFTMLSNPVAVEQVVLSPTGILSQLSPGTIWVDCSTVNPSFSAQAAKAAKAAGVHFLDAPVAGTLPHAENAQLTFFVGGEKKTFELVRPLLEKMGQKVLHLGEHSKGSAFKMLVNAMLAQSMVVFSETLLLGEKMGLSTSFLLEALPKLPVIAPFTAAKASMIEQDQYEVMFPLELMHKDLHLAAVTAYEVGQPLHLANLAKELFAKAKQQGMGRLDFAAIHRSLAAE